MGGEVTKQQRDILADKLVDAWDFHQNNETDAAWKALYDAVNLIFLELHRQDRATKTVLDNQV